MSVEPDRRPSGEAPDTVITSAKVFPFPVEHRQRPGASDAPIDKPIPDKKANKKHPPVKPLPPFTGKRVQDSPYYIDPTARHDLILAVTLDRKLTPSARDVFVLILHHYNHRKGYAFPGRERMAELLGLTKTAISAAIALLVERKWLLVEQPRADGHKGVNHYLPQLDKVDEILSAAGLKVIKTGPSDASKVRSDDEQGPVSQGSKVRSDDAARSGKPDSNPDTEPSEKNPEREPDTPKGAASPIVGLDDDFERFWEWYPHKVNKPVARKTFMAISGIDGPLYEDVMNGLVIYRDHLKASGDYPAAPASWLQNERWNDKPAPVAKRRAPASRDSGAGAGRLAI